MTLHASANSESLKAAHARGFALMQRELDTGQLAWTWVPPDGEPQPRFLTRREAIAYMDEKLQALES